MASGGCIQKIIQKSARRFASGKNDVAHQSASSGVIGD
jgi:hypothetical protein